MAHPRGLTHAELGAIVALQRGTSVPPPEEPVWGALIQKRLVWIDYGARPPELMLTPLGRRYLETPC
jgi:hypothetical protein